MDDFEVDDGKNEDDDFEDGIQQTRQCQYRDYLLHTSSLSILTSATLSNKE